MRLSARKKIHQSVNGLLLLLAFVLLGYALTTASPASLVHSARSMIASPIITSSAVVPSNPDNTLAEQLRQKEMNLNEREQHLAQLEMLRNQNTQRSTVLSLMSLVASLILFGLVGLNFYRDAQRDPRAARSLFSANAIDLRRPR